MVRFLRTPNPVPEEWPTELLAELRGPTPIFWMGRPDRAYLSLRSSGVALEIVGEEGVPDGSVVLVPDVERTPLDDLVWVVDRLLGPGGCPWDQEQTHESLKRHLLEEAYEVLDAIDAQDNAKFREELGDLLMQPVMHAQMQKRDGGFDIDDVARGIVDKLVRRHPHVFGTTQVSNADEVLKNWDQIKSKEKGGKPESLLAGVPKAMAALLRAYEVSKRAARAGFEWPDIDAVFQKLREEEGELRDAISGGNHEQVEGEVGDLLFTCVNLARWAGVEPEEALRQMLDRFTQRFQWMESQTAKPLTELSAEEWDALWESAKADLTRQ